MLELFIDMGNFGRFEAEEIAWSPKSSRYLSSVTTDISYLFGDLNTLFSDVVTKVGPKKHKSTMGVVQR